MEESNGGIKWRNQMEESNGGIKRVSVNISKVKQMAKTMFNHIR